VKVLSALAVPSRPEVLLGPETSDDAGVIDLGDNRALLQTVDFFPPVVDDPYDFGRIAAANALSDVYAMGGYPLSVLNIVGFPTRELSTDVLLQILQGGSAKIAEAGAALVGGHTVEDREIKYGLAVVGLVRKDRIMTNAGAKSGDAIFVTKPLGMGAINKAIKNGSADVVWIKEATDSMATLNAAAARAVARIGANAVTDITGFGLIGHALEMARASRVTLRLIAEHLPITPGAIELARTGATSGASRRNRAFAGHKVNVSTRVPEEIAALAFDAETSGGLLISLDAAKAEALHSALREEGVIAAKIGTIEKPEMTALVRLE
jgi:selenide,water dikinase